MENKESKESELKSIQDWSYWKENSQHLFKLNESFSYLSSENVKREIIEEIERALTTKLLKLDSSIQKEISDKLNINNKIDEIEDLFVIKFGKDFVENYLPKDYL